MQLKQRIENLINKKVKFRDYALISYSLCKTFGWDFYTLQKQPIPFVLDLLDTMEKIAKKEKEEMKKHKEGINKKPRRR